jgi:hypothetical protein
MKIAYVELDFHSECLNSFCYIFKNRQEQVEFYTSETIKNELSHNTASDNFTWIISGADRSSFLKNNINNINKNDIVFISTIQNSIRVFSSVKFTSPTILRVHSGNFYFNRTQNFCIPASLTEIIDSIYFFALNVIIRGEFKLLNKLTKDIKNISFTSKNIPHHFNELLKNKKLNLVANIPLEAFEPFYNEIKNDVFTIAIPGSVDVNKRNYEIVIDTLNTLKKQINQPIKIYLMGKPVGYKGRKMIEKFKALNDTTISVYTFDNEVKQTEFEKIMKRTNLILCPIKRIYNQYFYKEQVGFTKISGTISDIIRYGKYALIPEFYPIEKTIEKAITQYKSKDDLADKLLNVINRNSWLSAEEAAIIFDEYSSDAVYNKTMKVFDKIINT